MKTFGRGDHGLGPALKARLALRVVRSYLLVRWSINRKPLPVFVREFGQAAVRPDRHQPALLSRAVDRTLRLGPYRPRCLTTSLVLYRLLREQGEDVQLVIGLPFDALDHTAHAWIERDGVDLGPPPGRGRHSPIARFN